MKYWFTAVAVALLLVGAGFNGYTLVELRREQQAQRAAMSNAMITIAETKLLLTNNFFAPLQRMASAFQGASYDYKQYETEKQIKELSLQVETNWWDGLPGSFYITGIVTNTGSSRFSTVSITYNLYDKEGTQVGTAYDSVSNMDPFGRWKFKCNVYEKELPKAKLKELKGY